MPKLHNKLVLLRCPHCSVNSPNLNGGYEFETKTHSGENHRWWKLYVCQSCGGAVIAYSVENNVGEVEGFYPGFKMIDESIPSPASDYLIQAINSLHAPSGAIMLCASCVDAMLKAKNYSKGKLYDRIKKASEDHVITSEMETWAHDVRIEANEERHADENEPLPTSKEAQRVIDFTLALAEYLFVLPSRIKKGLIKDFNNTTENKV